MKPEDQLHRLHSRYGWIDGEVPVIPVALQLSLPSYNKAQLNNAYSLAPVTIFIGPQPRIGYTDDMRAAMGDPVEMAQAQAKGGPNHPLYQSDWDDLDEFLVYDASGIVDALKDIYFNGRKSAIVAYQDLKLQAILAGETAAESGHPYGIKDYVD